MKRLLLLFVVLNITSAYSQSFSFHPSLAGTYVSEKCLNSSGGPEELTIGTSDNELHDFSLNIRFCGNSNSQKFFGTKGYSGNGYSLTLPDADYQAYLFEYGSFEYVENRFAFVVSGYQIINDEEVLIEHFYFKKEKIDASLLLEYVPLGLEDEEEYRETPEQEFNYLVKTELPEGFSDIDWFNDFEGSCYFAEVGPGRIHHIQKNGFDYLMKWEINRYGDTTIWEFFYGNLGEGEIEEWHISYGNDWPNFQKAQESQLKKIDDQTLKLVFEYYKDNCEE